MYFQFCTAGIASTGPTTENPTPRRLPTTSAPTNMNAFDTHFGHGVHNQELFDEHFGHGVENPPYFSAFPSSYLADNLGAGTSHVADAFQTAFSKELEPEKLLPPTQLTKHGRPTSDANVPNVKKIRVQVDKDAGKIKVDKDKKCKCQLNTIESVPLKIRQIYTSPEQTEEDKKLLAEMRTQGFTTMKKCKCTAVSRHYICCDLCPENFSIYGKGQAYLDYKSRQSLMANSPFDKLVAAKGKKNGKINLTGHFGSFTHVFWRVVDAMSKILSEVIVAKENALAQQEEHWSKYMRLDSLWHKQKWTETNWMLCCNVLNNAHNDYPIWKEKYQTDMPGVLQDMTTQISMVFQKADNVLNMISPDLYNIPFKDGLSLLPIGYSSTDS